MVALGEGARDVGERRAAALLGLEPVGQVLGGTTTARRHRRRHRQQDRGLRDLHGVRRRIEPDRLGGLGEHPLRLGLDGGVLVVEVDRLRRDLVGLRGARVLTDHDVRVGATETEAGHARDGLTRVARPRRRLRDHLQVRLVELDVRVGARVVERRRDDVLLQREHDLDQARRARGGLEVTEVGLRRSEQRRLVVVTAAADDAAERVRLDRVAEDGAGAVRLDVVDTGRRDARVAVGVAEAVGLRVRVRREQAVGAAVLVDRGTRDDREDRVTVALGVLEPLEHDDAAALGADDSARVGREGLDLAVLGEDAALVEAERRGRGEQHVHATGQRDLGLARAQAADRLVHRDERRRARRVQRDRRAAEVVEVRDTIRDDRRGRARQGVRVRRRRIAHREQLVVVGRRAEEHTDVAALERARRNVSVLERLPRQLQRQPLLRVHILDLERRHREELGVEAVHVVEVTTLGGGLLDGGRDIRIGGELRPAALGQIGDRVTALDQQLPHLLRRVPGAREARREADDRDVVRLPARDAPAVVRGVVAVRGQLRLTLDDAGGQRGDGRMLVDDRGRERDAHEILDLPRQRDRVAGGETELLQRAIVGYRRRRLPGGLSDPVAHPLAQLRDRHLVFSHQLTKLSVRKGSSRKRRPGTRSGCGRHAASPRRTPPCTRGGQACRWTYEESSRPEPAARRAR